MTVVDTFTYERAAALPAAVREAREAAFGLAAFGIAYPVVLGVTIGGGAAGTGALQFAPGVLLGIVALGFGSGDALLRRLALILAAVQIVLGLRVAGEVDLGVIPVLTVFYAWIVSGAVVHLLRRPQAKEWFGVS
ncbi:hypothetical protein ACWEKT_31625 [Nocardia takedensis]|uniref:hypothetical protein n=1 Tax=Nocardia takedensis TaxID=259390 RepID=UPI0002F4CCFF|nr:hypothetical protein [Nocardia takedensis]